MGKLFIKQMKPKKNSKYHSGVVDPKYCHKYVNGKLKKDFTDLLKYIQYINSKNSFDFFTEDICECEWLIKLNPGNFIDIPEDFIDDTINKMNFHYRIMKKYKIDRKEQKNSIVYRMEGHNFYATREKLMKEGFVLVDSYYNDDNGRVSGCLLEKNDNIVGISIPGLAPHPSMDDIIIAFNQNLFHEIGRIFPQLWMAHSYDDPMNIKAFFRYSDLYNVE